VYCPTCQKVWRVIAHAEAEIRCDHCGRVVTLDACGDEDSRDL
jgi:ribosomal protein S27E